MHRHSPRAKAPFIALNMAAIPKELIEWGVFGHEKGVFMARIPFVRGVLNRPMAVHYPSTKLVICRWTCRRVCCACWQTSVLPRRRLCAGESGCADYRCHSPESRTASAGR
ncbi:sigma 54-interacting transcriptional regulator [Shigella flexneri]